MPDMTGELRLPRPYPFTREQYVRMAHADVFAPDHNAELLCGGIYLRDSQSPAHAWALQRLNAKLVRALGGSADVFVRASLAAGADSMPDPDLYITRPNADATDYPDHALLVVEVADTSLATDRDIKGPLYAAAGVPEYWIVDLTHQVFEIYRDPRNGRYASLVTLGLGEFAHAIAVEGLSVDIAAVLA